MNFDYEQFCVQFDDLPLACMNGHIGKQIGSKIGRIFDMRTYWRYALDVVKLLIVVKVVRIVIWVGTSV